MIAFVAADVWEFSGLLQHLKHARRIDGATRFELAAELNGEPVTLAAHGPGPALAGMAAKALLGRAHVRGMISYGLCGALSEDLAIGDVFIANEVVDDSGKTISGALFPAFAGRPFASGRLLSIDRVACTVEEKGRLRTSGASAVEMEAAGVALLARQAGVPFYCIRAVSDGASQSLALDFNQVRDGEGRFNRTRILAAALRDPLRRIPKLIAFGQTTRKVAQTLGDFIASCRI